MGWIGKWFWISKWLEMMGYHLYACQLYYVYKSIMGGCMEGIGVGIGEGYRSII